MIWRSRAWALGGCCAALAVTSGSAVAAEGPEAPTTVQELIVTGSRLPKADLIADSPIVTVSREDVLRSGALTLDLALNRLPQVVPSYSSAANNPSANGASYVDLRGLGENRNLVLLDGRRVIGANASNSVDLNTIPAALIERVEVITGGASAVYGADAVAGVVNVILKPRFEGLEAAGRTLVSERGDGREHDVSVTAGHAFERANIMASVGWAKRDEIGKGERDFSSQAATPSSAIPTGTYNIPGLNAPSLATVNAVFAQYGVAPGAVSTRAGALSFNADGTLFYTGQFRNPTLQAQNYRGPMSDVVTAFFPDVYAYNFEPFNKLILPLERRSGAIFADAQVTDRITVFGRVMGTRYTAETALAPTPAPTDPNPLYPGLDVFAFTIPATNPFIPPDLATLLASRRGDVPALEGSGASEEFPYRFRTVALGARESSNKADTYNLLGGMKADLGGDWRAEMFASYGRYKRRETQGGLLNVRRLEQLLDSPTGGTEFCQDGFNPFSGGGPISSACADFLGVRATYRTEIEQENAVASTSGPMFRLPAGPLLAALGFEYRRVSYDFRPPQGIEPGDLAGFLPQLPVSGSVRFLDVFAEASAPLLADRPFARALDLTVGYRRSDERTTGGVNSFKGELGWKPVEALKLRAAVQRAVRAPDILERYEPAYRFFAVGTDPCAVNTNPDRSQAVLDLCRRQAAALGFDPSAADELEQGPEVGVINGGNPDLRPEKATTYTLGLVWRPRWDSDWAGDFYASLDWYDIEVKGAIAYADPQLTLDACYNIGGDTNPTYDPAHPACQSFRRSSVDFSLVDIQALQSNQTKFVTSGVDMQLGFRTDLAALSGRDWLGRLDTSMQLSWLDRFEQQNSPAQPRIDYAGTIAGAVPGYQSLPKWKGLGTVTWSSGPVQLAVTGRFIDGMEHRSRRTDPDSTIAGVGSAWYWDLSGRWSVNRRAELRAGVLNLFDRGPEIYEDAVDAKTDPSTYDVVGRRFWIGLTLRL